MVSGELRDRARGLMADVSGVARQSRWWSALCVIFLCLVPLLLFPSAAFGGEIWTIGDLGNYNYPLHVEIMRQWRSGTVPLWNPYIMSGTPLAAAMQGGVFYPPNWPLILLPDALGFVFSILAHIALVGVFTFFYLRSIRLSHWASLTGALVFQLSGFTMGHLGHVAMLRAIPWLPFMLWALQKWSDDRDWRWVSLGALGVGFAILAGYPQVSAYALLTALAYLVFLFFQAEERRWRLLGGGMVLFTLGVGAAGVQLLLTAALWPEYRRIAGASFGYFSSLSFHPSYVLKMIVPMPGAELDGYVGVAPLLLVAANLPFKHSKRKKRLFIFFGGLAVVALLLAAGIYTPLARWTYYIPVYRSFSVLSRHLLEFDFSLAVLAALGLDLLIDLVRDKKVAWISRRQALKRGLVGVVLITAWLVLWVVAGSGNPANGSSALVWSERVSQGVIRAAGIVVVVAGSLWLAKRFWWPWAAIAVLILIFFDLSRTTGRIYTPHLHPVESVDVPADLVASLQQDEMPYRALGFVPHSGDPFFAEPRRPKWLMANFNMLVPVESAAGFDAVILSQLDAVTNRTLPTHGLITVQALYDAAFVRYLNLAGVKYLVVPREAEVPADLDEVYPVIFENPWVQVRLNSSAVPRISYTAQFETVTHESAVQAMQQGNWNGQPFDPQKLALIEPGGDGQPSTRAVGPEFGSTLFLVHQEIVGPAGAGQETAAWELVTWWACQEPVPDNYTLYVHLLDGGGELVAQADHLLGYQTSAGYHPSGTWACPALLRDTVQLPVRDGDEFDQLQVAVGLWIPETGRRLAPDGDDWPVDEHGRVRLGPAEELVSPPASRWEMSNLVQGPDYVSVEVTLAQPGIVVHGTNYSAGWRVRLNGQPVSLLRVNGFLQGVYVPAGAHHLEFVYRPPSFYVGAGTSLLALVVIGAIFWHEARRLGAA